MDGDILIRWFTHWIKLKIKIHNHYKEFYFRDKEIWWASLGANIGFEQNGKNESYERPVLVLRKFGKDMLWAIPLTSKNKIGPFYYDLLPIGFNSRLILSQMRLISSKRLIRKVGIVPLTSFMEIKNKVKALI